MYPGSIGITVPPGTNGTAIWVQGTITDGPSYSESATSKDETSVYDADTGQWGLESGTEFKWASSQSSTSSSGSGTFMTLLAVPHEAEIHGDYSESSALLSQATFDEAWSVAGGAWQRDSGEKTEDHVSGSGYQYSGSGSFREGIIQDGVYDTYEAAHSQSSSESWIEVPSGSGWQRSGSGSHESSDSYAYSYSGSATLSETIDHTLASSTPPEVEEWYTVTSQTARSTGSGTHNGSASGTWSDGPGGRVSYDGSVAAWGSTSYSFSSGDVFEYKRTVVHHSGSASGSSSGSGSGSGSGAGSSWDATTIESWHETWLDDKTITIERDGWTVAEEFASGDTSYAHQYTGHGQADVIHDGLLATTYLYNDPWNDDFQSIAFDTHVVTQDVYDDVDYQYVYVAADGTVVDDDVDYSTTVSGDRTIQDIWTVNGVTNSSLTYESYGPETLAGLQGFAPWAYFQDPETYSFRAPPATTQSTDGGGSPAEGLPWWKFRVADPSEQMADELGIESPIGRMVLDHIAGGRMPVPITPDAFAAQINGIMESIDRSITVYEEGRETGQSVTQAALTAIGVALADQVGITAISDAWEGHELLSNRELPTWERWLNGTLGTIQLVGSAAGIYAGGARLGGQLRRVRIDIDRSTLGMNLGNVRIRFADKVDDALGAAAGKVDDVPTGAPKGYGHLSDRTKVEPGRLFQPQQKEKILEANRQRNGGKLMSDDPNDPWYGKELQGPGPRRYAGDRVPPYEAQVDHIVPRIGPDGKPLGTNAYSNARVISQEYNNFLRNKKPNIL